MEKINLRLLTHEDFCYNYDVNNIQMLGAIRTYGITAPQSDFALANGLSHFGKLSPYWYQGTIRRGYARSISSPVHDLLTKSDDSTIGIRFKASLSETKGLIDIPDNKDDMIIAKGFEYVSDIVDFDLQRELTTAAKNGTVIKTGKTYTRGLIFDEESQKYKFEEVEEVYYNGKKYVFMDIKQNCVLSDGYSYGKGEYCWFAVDKIPLIVSKKEDTVVSKEIVTSGIAFSYSDCETIEDSFVYRFLDSVLSRELIPSTNFRKTVSKDNMYQLPLSDNIERLNIRTLCITNEEIDKIISNGSIIIADPVGGPIKIRHYNGKESSSERVLSLRKQNKKPD